MPAGWSPVNEDPKSVSIHFWDREEFFGYVNFHPNPSKLLAWITGSYSKALKLEPDSEVAKNELEYIAQQRSKDAAEPPVPWFVHAILHPPQDLLTLELLDEIRGLPSIPGPKTVGTENYSRFSRAFQERGWVGFEAEFDELVPRTRSDYCEVKRQLLCEPLFNPEAHRNMTRLLAASSELSSETSESILDEIFGPEDAER